MEINPLKVVQRKRKLKIEIFLCLICGKSAGKEALGKPQKQEIQKFIQALKVRKRCNRYTRFNLKKKKKKKKKHLMAPKLLRFLLRLTNPCPFSNNKLRMILMQQIINCSI